MVFVTSIVICLPYLTYTFSITGKVFYWATNGGNVLYWMSSPHSREYGDWFAYKDFKTRPELASNHKDFFDETAHLSPFQKDRLFRKKAIANILSHPFKYLHNWAANIGRLLFNYPYSYRNQSLTKYYYIIPNMFLLVVGLLCVYPFYRSRKLVPEEIKILLYLALIYLGGSSLVSAVNRYFSIVVPVFLFWLSFVLIKNVQFKMNYK